MTLDVNRIRGIDYRRAFDGISNGSGVLTCDINFFAPAAGYKAYVTQVGIFANAKVNHFQGANHDALAVIEGGDTILRTFMRKEDIFNFNYQKVNVGAVPYNYKKISVAEAITPSDSMGFGGYDIADTPELSDAATDNGLSNNETVSMGVKSHLVPLAAIGAILPDEYLLYRTGREEVEIDVDLTAETATTNIITPLEDEVYFIKRITIIPNGTNNIKFIYNNPGSDIEFILGTTTQQLYAMADGVDGDGKITYNLSPHLVLKDTTDLFDVVEVAPSNAAIKVIGYKTTKDSL